MASSVEAAWYFVRHSLIPNLTGGLLLDSSTGHALNLTKVPLQPSTPLHVAFTEMITSLIFELHNPPSLEPFRSVFVSPRL
jgi:hypothetical protein